MKNKAMRVLRTLLAEDESAVLDLREEYLNVDDHTVERAQDGREAVARAVAVPSIW